MSRLLAAILAACIVLLSPGPDALAYAIKAAAPAKGVPAGRIAAPVSGLAPASFLAPGPAPADLGVQVLPGVRAPVAPQAQARGAAAVQVPALPHAAAVPALPPVPVLAAAAPAAEQASLRSLQSGVESIRAAEAPAQQRFVLERLFTGSRRRAAADAALAAAVEAGTRGTAAPAELAAPAAQKQVQGQPPPPAPSAPPAAQGPDFNKKAVIALFVTRTLSIISFILTSIAYPFVAAPAVGWVIYGTLMALGPLAAIATGPLNGIIADRLSARNSMVINMVIRSVLSLALPGFAAFGVLNFWTLLVSSVANGWILSSTMTTENAYIRRLAGQHQGTVTVLSSVHYVGMQVFLGLILGIGAVVDKANPLLAFIFSAVMHGVIAVILWFTMPNDKPQAKAAGSGGALLDKARAFFGKYWKELLLVAGAVGSYVFLHSPLPIAAALFYWVLRSDTVRNLRSGAWREVSPRENEISARIAELEAAGGSPDEIAALKSEAKIYQRRQFRAMLLNATQAVLTYPLQNFALPLIAVTLVGTSGKALLLGRLLGAIFFGNLIANSTQTDKLPAVRLPFIGRVPGQRLVQAGVLGLAAVWAWTSLVPGSVLAALAAAGAAAGLMWAVRRLSQRGWIKFLGVGLAAVWLPFLVWTIPGLLPFMSVQTALFLSMLIYGLFTGPSSVAFTTYQQENTRKSDLGKIFGIGSSFFNTFNSFGYGLLALAAGLVTPAFPALLLPISIAYLAGAAVFWRAPKYMPGLPESVTRKLAPPKS